MLKLARLFVVLCGIALMVALSVTLVAAAGNGIPQSQLDEMVAKALESKDPLPAYALIDALDRLPVKENHPVPGWSLTTGDEGAVVWTGSYIPDPYYGGSVVPLVLDGKTGAWFQLPRTTVVWQTAGGSVHICSTCAPSVLAPVAPAVHATGALSKTMIVDIINTYKVTDSDKIYVELDKVVDSRPDARLRASGTMTYTAKNCATLIWVKSGEISGDVVELDQTDGKSLYLVTADSVVTVTYAHSGVQLDAPIDPAADFPWWGSQP